MDEFDIIARHFAPLAGAGGFGLTDDAGVIAQRPGHDLVVTTDAIMEGVDFFGFDPAETVAKKALRVNLSDLAAKGAVPAFYLLNLSLTHSITPAWLESFAAGLADDQRRFGISLLGGDTGATDGPLGIAVTAFGYVPEGTMIPRAGARDGDGLYVTGTIGESGGGLAIFKREKHTLADGARDALIARYRIPEPPVLLGPKLRGLVHAALDVSDGLIADVGHLAKASGLRAEITGEHVPLSDGIRALWGDNALLRAVTAGDDYQIAFAADPTRETEIRAAALACGVSITRIGRFVTGEGVTLLVDGNPVAVPRPGYRHF